MPMSLRGGALALPQQLAAPKAKVIGRRMGPGRLPWRAYFHHWLYRSREWLDAPRWRTSVSCVVASSSPAWNFRHMRLPARVGTYTMACRQLAPYLLADRDKLPSQDILQEPLFRNGRIIDPNTHLSFAWLMWARRALPSVGDLPILVNARLDDVDMHPGFDLITMLAAQLASWRAALQCAAPQAEWMTSMESTDRRVGRTEASRQLHIPTSQAQSASFGLHPPQHRLIHPAHGRLHACGTVGRGKQQAGSRRRRGARPVIMGHCALVRTPPLALPLALLLSRALPPPKAWP